MSLDCVFVWFTGSFVCWKSLGIEVFLAPDTPWHGIGQENEEGGKPDAPEPPAHAGASTQRCVTLENGSISGGPYFL